MSFSRKRRGKNASGFWYGDFWRACDHMLLYKKEACATRVQQMRDETIRPHHCYDRGGKDRCIPESPRARYATSRDTGGSHGVCHPGTGTDSTDS
jgi:hypothetical protein